jgi:hypothetical protein
MLIGILSDTHDNLTMIARALSEYRARGVDALVHAGDFVSPFAMQFMVKSELPIVAVFGNNDGEKEGLKQVCEDIFNEPHRFELAGRTIVLTHTPEVLSKVLEAGDDLGICGHTHSAEISVGPPLVVNPGETCGWLSGRSTGVIVELTDLSAELIEFGRQEIPTI